MAEVYVARQAIFDRGKRVVGYELLFRAANVLRSVPKDTSTQNAEVVLNAVTEIGLDQILAGREAWLRVSREFIAEELEQLLPVGSVLEIAKDEPVDYELMAAVTALKRRGGRVALDGFRFSPEEELLLRLADVVKLDLVDLGPERFHQEVAHARMYGAKVLANRVENRADHAFCLSEGCDLFQGYFFCRPDVMHGNRIEANRMVLMDLLAALSAPEVEVAELQERISLDVGLSLRLLRYLNSAYFGLRQPVRSIAQAVTMLGTDRLRRWAMLTLFASVQDKPSELTIVALIRARFCELVAGERDHLNADDAFTSGLFSVIDALLDAPIADALGSIPLAPDIRSALVLHDGALGNMLECLLALESGDFERAEGILPGTGANYRTAIVWADDAAQSLFAEESGVAA